MTRRAQPLHIPPALPILSRGKHLSPADGACVMELVSVMAGERWTDHPRCTHPALAELARVVNDLLPDGEQALLVDHVSALVGLRPKDLRVTPTLARLCLDTQAAVSPDGRQRRRSRAAVRRLDAINARRRRWWLVATEPMYRVGPARLAMSEAAYALVRANRENATEDLLRLLGRAIELCSALDRRPSAKRPAPASQVS